MRRNQEKNRELFLFVFAWPRPSQRLTERDPSNWNSAACRRSRGSYAASASAPASASFLSASVPTAPPLATASRCGKTLELLEEELLPVAAAASSIRSGSMPSHRSSRARGGGSCLAARVPVSAGEEGVVEVFTVADDDGISFVSRRFHRENQLLARPLLRRRLPDSLDSRTGPCAGAAAASRERRSPLECAEGPKSIPKSGRVPCSLDQFSFFFSACRGDNRKNAGYRTDTSSLERFAFFRSRPKRGPLLDTLQLSPRPFVSRLVQSTNRNAPCRALAAREQRRQGQCPSSRGSVGRRRRCSIGLLALAAALPRGAPRVLAGQQQLAAAGQHDDCEPGPERGPERLLAQLRSSSSSSRLRG